MVEKIIHQIVGPRQTRLVAHCLRSWHILAGREFSIRIWNDNTINSFIAEHFPFALPALLHARNHGEASDIARYLIIHHFGGYYMDWDIELLDADAFEQLGSAAPEGFLVTDPFNDTLASECFAAVTGEAYLLSLAKDIVDLYNSGLRDNYKTPQYSGPYRMKDSFQLHNNSSQRLIPVNDVFVYNYREIRAMPKRTATQPLIHYWAHSWLQPGH
ncbi:MAG TPA: glycosyltransferase [Chitinophaga sp.]|uniref:glycosyltransferase family 32 protein n=1 Tax=Chitinophaga sp. TaxID=1869181 RepID=UPI002C2C0491|nr:glycosyltransferase [Chitinophaga sp.]HVI43847.1 glycosyltransferase [Chitinophaga sp.]